ncbi:MAG: response regulator transcription factor [Chloroflexota bacterium]
MGEKILLIDSARLASDDLVQDLEGKGYKVNVARSSKVALREAMRERPDLIILDTTSSRFNGKRLCAALYQKVDAPIIAIMHKKSEPLEHADEHVTNPINRRKLGALIRRILKVKQPWVMKLGDLVLDLKKRTVARGSRAKRLRPMEVRLLKTFMRRPNEVITRAELMKLVWDTDFTGDTRTLDVHIRWVRERIEDNPSKPKLLKTVRGQGYKLEV